MEVRGESSLTLNRKCVVVRWGDLTLERFLDLIQRGAGGLIILIPRQWERSVLQVRGNLGGCFGKVDKSVDEKLM